MQYQLEDTLRVLTEPRRALDDLDETESAEDVAKSSGFRTAGAIVTDYLVGLR